MTRLNDILPGVVIYMAPIEGSERQTVAALARESLGAAIGHYPDGAPFIVGREDTPISISHGAGRALLAVGEPGMKIGVDIESSSRDAQLRRVAPRFVGPSDHPSLSLLHLWTAKEAAYKALRTAGLPLTAIAVTPASAAALPIAWHPLPAALIALVATR